MWFWLLRALVFVALFTWAVRRLSGGPREQGALAAWARWCRQRGAGPAVRPPAAAATDPHAVLGVARGASQAEIRAAYQRQMQNYHPDQVAHLGDELREVAERRTKAINAAYAALRRGGRP